jgi:hypothetical protein
MEEVEEVQVLGDELGLNSTKIAYKYRIMRSRSPVQTGHLSASTTLQTSGVRRLGATLERAPEVSRSSSESVPHAFGGPLTKKTSYDVVSHDGTGYCK